LARRFTQLTNQPQKGTAFAEELEFSALDSVKKWFFFEILAKPLQQQGNNERHCRLPPGQEQVRRPGYCVGAKTFVFLTYPEDSVTMRNGDEWADAQRIESWAGEMRVNLLRLSAILVLYGHHLINVYLVQDDPTLTADFHTAVTALVLAWSLSVLVLHYCLVRRWVPTALKYVATVWDIVLITTMLGLSANPYSSLPALYILVIVAAALRLSLPLIYTATLGGMAAYVFYLGYLRFWLQLHDNHRWLRTQQVIVLLVLGAGGILVGQVVRQSRRLVFGYPVSVAKPKE
jgi:hypothetical protein